MRGDGTPVPGFRFRAGKMRRHEEAPLGRRRSAAVRRSGLPRRRGPAGPAPRPRAACAQRCEAQVYIMTVIGRKGK